MVHAIDGRGDDFKVPFVRAWQDINQHLFIHELFQFCGFDELCFGHLFDRAWVSDLSEVYGRAVGLASDDGFLAGHAVSPFMSMRGPEAPRRLG